MDNKELKALRGRLGYNLSAFSKKVGIERTTLTKMEKGMKVLTETKVKQIKKAIGFEGEKKSAEIQVKVDYLKLTFFDIDVEKVIKEVLGINFDYFSNEENKRYNYDTVHRCGSILLRSQSEKMRQERNSGKEFVEQGVLLDLTSQGIAEFEELLEVRGQTLFFWLRKVLNPEYYLKNGLYSRIHSTRFDIAIDEMWNEKGKNFDLDSIDRKRKEGLFYSTLQVYKKIDSRKNEKDEGITLSFGNRGGEGVYIRMYEKRYELSKRLRMDVEDVLEQYGIWNRYELELGKRVNAEIFDKWLSGERLEELAVDLLLSKIEVYDQLGVTGEKVGCKAWYDLFGSWKKIKISNSNEEVSLERTMRWLEKAVMPSILYVVEIFGKQTVLQWISDRLEEAELTARKKAKLKYEQMLVKEAKRPEFKYLLERQKDIEFEEVLYGEEYEVVL